MNNAPYGKTIDHVGRRPDIRLLNDMKNARRLDEKSHSVEFRVFDGQVTPFEVQEEAPAAEEQQLQEALMGIEMRKLNPLIKSFDRSLSPMASACWSTAAKDVCNLSSIVLT